MTQLAGNRKINEIETKRELGPLQTIVLDIDGYRKQVNIDDPNYLSYPELVDSSQKLRTTETEPASRLQGTHTKIPVGKTYWLICWNNIDISLISHDFTSHAYKMNRFSILNGIFYIKISKSITTNLSKTKAKDTY